MGRLASLFLEKDKESEQLNNQEIAEPGKTVYKILFVDDEENVLRLCAASSGERTMPC